MAKKRAKINIKTERQPVAKISQTPVYTVEQAAEYLGLTARAVRFYCAQGRLGCRIGPRLFVITQQELEEFAAKPRPVGNPGAGIFRRQALNADGERLDVLGLIGMLEPGERVGEMTVSARHLEIARARASGKNLHELSLAYSVSRERIRQITAYVEQAIKAKRLLVEKDGIRTTRKKKVKK